MNEATTRALRINEQLMQYWHELKGERPLPLESEINTDALKDIWPSCFLITVKPNGFAYDYLGRDLLEAYGDDLTGREITEALLYPHPPTLFAKFRDIVNTAIPATDDSEFTNSRGAHVKYRSSVVPFASRGREGVSFLLGGMRWKLF
jgi:hypothetical protein